MGFYFSMDIFIMIEERMIYMSHRKSRSRRSYTHEEIQKSPYQKILKKNYHVTSQTAYHITKMALQENTSEGRIIDKLMRTYLCTQETRTFL